MIQCEEEEATGPLSTDWPTESPVCGWPAPATVWGCSSLRPGCRFQPPCWCRVGSDAQVSPGLGPALQTPSLGHPVHRHMAGCAGVCPPLPLPLPTAVKTPSQIPLTSEQAHLSCLPSCAHPVLKSSSTCRPVPHPVAPMTPLNSDRPSLLPPPPRPLRVASPATRSCSRPG